MERNERGMTDRTRKIKEKNRGKRNKKSEGTHETHTHSDYFYKVI
jgi:hypothetical protein